MGMQHFTVERDRFGRYTAFASDGEILATAHVGVDGKWHTSTARPLDSYTITRIQLEVRRQERVRWCTA